MIRKNFLHLPYANAGGRWLVVCPLAICNMCNRSRVTVVRLGTTECNTDLTTEEIPGICFYCLQAMVNLFQPPEVER